MAASESSSRKIFVSVASSLIAATILGALSIYVPTFREWEVAALKWLKSAVVAAWEYLAATHSVVGWLIVIGVLAVLLLLRFALRACIRLLKSGLSNAAPSQYDYTSDHFEGVRWCWTYFHGQISNRLVARCPTCAQVLVYREDFEYTEGFGRESRPVTIYRCENCGGDVARCVGSWNQVQGRVTRSIDRKLESGEWQQVVEAQQRKR